MEEQTSRSPLKRPRSHEQHQRNDSHQQYHEPLRPDVQRVIDGKFNILAVDVSMLASDVSTAYLITCCIIFS
jgi:hypothetical protein